MTDKFHSPHLNNWGLMVVDLFVDLFAADYLSVVDYLFAVDYSFVADYLFAVDYLSVVDYYLLKACLLIQD